MSRLRSAPIVEGHGEVESMPILLRRIWLELLGREHVHVLSPLRRPRSKLVQADELGRAVEYSVRRLAADRSPQGADLVLLLLDGNSDAVCQLAPRLLQVMRATRPDADLACVLANVEYESWFVAAADSLAEHLVLDVAAPSHPERDRAGKGRIQARIRAPAYAETVDQPTLTAAMDLATCRARSPSFDKLCRELEQRGA